MTYAGEAIGVGRAMLVVGFEGEGLSPTLGTN